MKRASWQTRTKYNAIQSSTHRQSGVFSLPRRLTTLAIETSCDDTSVAVLSTDENDQDTSKCVKCRIKYHKTVTAQTQRYGGIHPSVALESHQVSIANLVSEARQCLAEGEDFKQPDFISVTRGPGSAGSLAVGLMVAKGLATAWNVPLLGVHHMQAHALTPRLCSALDNETDNGHVSGSAASGKSLQPSFPYLTILASGGHTMLLRSNSLIDHKLLASTHDIAIGDCIDKAARAILPAELFDLPYGRALERFAFPAGAVDHAYTAPRSRKEELQKHITNWGWSLPVPIAENNGLDKSNRRMMFSFSGLVSSLERIMQYGVADIGSYAREERSNDSVTLEERRSLAREVLRIAFQHLVSRVLLYLRGSDYSGIDKIVISGGVASNQYLRHVIRQMLDAQGFEHIRTVFPPAALCTDNALMIAWAGMEMYQAGFRTSLDITPIRKWSMDTGIDGGILGVPGWVTREAEG